MFGRNENNANKNSADISEVSKELIKKGNGYYDALKNFPTDQVEKVIKSIGEFHFLKLRDYDKGERKL